MFLCGAVFKLTNFERLSLKMRFFLCRNDGSSRAQGNRILREKKSSMLLPLHNGSYPYNLASCLAVWSLLSSRQSSFLAIPEKIVLECFRSSVPFRNEWKNLPRSITRQFLLFFAISLGRFFLPSFAFRPLVVVQQIGFNLKALANISAQNARTLRNYYNYYYIITTDLHKSFIKLIKRDFSTEMRYAISSEAKKIMEWEMESIKKYNNKRKK